MKTTDISNCELFVEEKEDDFTQWNVRCSPTRYIFHNGGDSVIGGIVSNIQRCEGATGVVVNYTDDTLSEVMDDEDLELEIYTYSHTI